MVVKKQLRDVKNKEISWLWRPYIPFSKVTLIQGDTGIGKTSLVVKIVADLSRGLCPPTMYRGELQRQESIDPIKTYYVSVENGIDDTIAPLFDHCGGDRDYVDWQDESKGHFILNAADMRECIEQSGAKLVVVDPWQQFLDERTNASDNSAIRRMIGEIQGVAEETGAAIVLAGNYTKNPGAEIRRGLGGSELANTLRSVLTIVQPSADTPSLRLLTVTKMSFLGKDVTPVGIYQNEDYSIEYRNYRAMDNDAIHKPETLAGKDGEAVHPENDVPNGGQTRGAETILFLKSILSDGPLDSNEVKNRAKTAGYSMSTINRVKHKAGVRIEKQSDKSSLWVI